MAPMETDSELVPIGAFVATRFVACDRFEIVDDCDGLQVAVLVWAAGAASPQPSHDRQPPFPAQLETMLQAAVSLDAPPPLPQPP